MTLPERTFSANSGDLSTGTGGPDALETDIDAIIGALSALISADTTDYVLPSTNLLTNGGFEVWQRGAGPFSVTGAYGPDRWVMELDGTDTLSVSREGTTKKTNSQYSAKCVFVKGTGATTTLKQVLWISDGYHHLLGKVVNLRVSVHANASNAIRLKVVVDGTGGAATVSSYHTGGSTFESLDVASISIPLDATYIVIQAVFDAACTAYLDNAMLIPGPIALDYMPLHPAEEIQRCQRYYEVHGGVNPSLQVRQSVSGAHEFSQCLSFNTVKAGTPTVTKNGTWTVVNCSQPAIAAPCVNGYEIYATASGSGQVQFGCNGADDTVTAEYNP